MSFGDNFRKIISYSFFRDVIFSQLMKSVVFASAKSFKITKNPQKLSIVALRYDQFKVQCETKNCSKQGFVKMVGKGKWSLLEGCVGI